MLSIKIRAVIGLALSLLVLDAQAALVQLCGPAICYEYDNNLGANPGLAYYGNPTLLSGSDTIKFTPTSFAVDSDPGTTAIPTPTLSAGFIFTRIWSPYGMEISTISVSEDGDYQILGDASVGATLDIVVNDLIDDGSPTLGFPEQVSNNQVFGTSTPTGLALANWSLSGSVGPAAAFADFATSVDLFINSTLQAQEGPGGGYSFIANKLLLTVATEGSIPVDTIPVPAAAWLLGSALGLLAAIRRRVTAA